MSTIKPRLCVTLEPHQYRLIKRLGALRGVPMSKVILELFEATEPVLGRVLLVLEAAAKAQTEAKEGMKRNAEQVEAAMQPMIDSILHQFDEYASDLVDQMDAGRRRSAGNETRSAPSPTES